MALGRHLVAVWFFGQAALVMTLVTPRTVHAADPDGKPRVLIIEPRPVVLPGLGQRALRNAVETVVRTNEAEVIPARRATAAGACETPACLRRTATEAKATHVFRVDGEYANEGYRLQLTLWVDATAQQVKGELLRCQICTATEMLAAAREQATALWSKRNGPSPEPTPPARPAEPAPPEPDLTRPDSGTPSPALGTSTPGDQDNPPTERPAWKTVLPLVGIVAGVGSIAVGAYLLSTQGGCANAGCTYNWKNRRTPGLATVGGGIVALGLGAWGFYTWRF